jgi:hypothetical protein
MPATMYLRCCTVPTYLTFLPLPLFTLPLETVSSHSVGWIHLEMGVCRLLARVTGTWEKRGAASCITANCHVATPRLVWCGTYPTLGPGHFRLGAAPTERQASTLRRPSSKNSPIGLGRAFPPLHRAVCRQSLAGHQACFTVQTIGGVAVAWHWSLDSLEPAWKHSSDPAVHAFVSITLRRYTTPSLWIHDSRLANTTTTNLGASRSCWQIWRRSHPKRLRHVSQYVDRHEKDCCIPTSTVPPLHGQPSNCQASPPHDPSGIGATHAISNSTWTCKWVVGGKSRTNACCRVDSHERHACPRSTTNWPRDQRQTMENKQSTADRGRERVCSSNFLVGLWEKRGARGAEIPAEVLQASSASLGACCLTQAH